MSREDLPMSNTLVQTLQHMQDVNAQDLGVVHAEVDALRIGMDAETLMRIENEENTVATLNYLFAKIKNT